MTARAATSATSAKRLRRLDLAQARGVHLAAQGLLDPLPTLAEATPGPEVVQATLERLGVLQVDTINVVRRAQYLTLWSRLGAYDDASLDALLHPHRATFEYWSHAASILPMSDYPYYRPDMLRAAKHLYDGDVVWMRRNPHILEQTRAAIRARGPLASADFERPNDGRRAEAWDWYGLKESRRALHVLWTTGDLMVHSRRGGQKVYDLRERVLAEAYTQRGRRIPRDSSLPTPEEQLRYFVRRTVAALGIVTPSWLWDYFRLNEYSARTRESVGAGNKRAAAQALLDDLVRARVAVPVSVPELGEPAYVARERLPDLERLAAGEVPARTTFLGPFDSVIWDRARARALFGYEVTFEAYVVPEKRRFGYYTLAILHQGRIVGRIDPKMDRDEGVLRVRGLWLQPGEVADAALLDGIADALRDLARFVRAERISVEQTEDPALLAPLADRVTGVPVSFPPGNTNPPPLRLGAEEEEGVKIGGEVEARAR